jgi:hypothetical protein
MQLKGISFGLTLFHKNGDKFLSNVFQSDNTSSKKGISHNQTRNISKGR